jgi:hypothetical protein
MANLNNFLHVMSVNLFNFPHAMPVDLGNFPHAMPFTSATSYNASQPCNFPHTMPVSLCNFHHAEPVNLSNFPHLDSNSTRKIQNTKQDKQNLKAQNTFLLSTQSSRVVPSG